MSAERWYTAADLAETVAITGPGSAATERGPWQPINLNTLPDKPPVRPTLGGIGLVYPGKRHIFSGPPESAKTLAAYVALIQVVRGGSTAILIDFEMGGWDARSRLRELGATDHEIDRIHYLEPDEPANEQRILGLVALEPSLVVIDAAAGAYSLEGLNDNDRGDVEKLSTLYVRAFWRAGIATVFIDHVQKNTEARGRFVIGSERKLGGVDVHLGFDATIPISRGTSGLYKITTHKDRGGYLKRGHIADLKLDSDPDTHAIAWTFTTPTAATGDAGYFRPTHLMEKVSIDLELRPGPVSRNTVAATLGGTKDYVLKAINALVLEGFVTESDGPNRSKLLESARRYRENDPSCNPESTSGGSVVLSSSAVVREPQWFGGSGGSPTEGGDTTDHHHPDGPRQGQWFDDLQAPFDPTWADQVKPDED